ncbi:hypothetical protein DRQ32_01550 [bacterium]|nr:MAG: hypothetical protein DRQ32_01550 [bacterium]
MVTNDSPRILRISVSAMFVALVLVAGCSGSTTEPVQDTPAVLMPPPASNTPVPAFNLPAQAYDDRSMYASYPGFSPEQYDEIAAMPMAMFSLRFLLSESATPVIARLRELNPDIVIIGVQQVLSVPDRWGNPESAQRFPFGAGLHRLLANHAAMSDQGEPILMWDGAPMINPMRGDSFDQALLTRFLNEISYWATEFPGQFDGIMHDYTSPRPWAWPAGDDSLEGSIDFDGDGIPFDEDANEQAAWIGWQYALTSQLQERFGEGFIQIANGRLPLDDRDFAQQLAGVIFENFPRSVWNFTPQRGLDYAIQMRQPGWLVPRRGQYWNFYWATAPGIDGMINFRRHTSLLTGDTYETNGTTSTVFNGTDPDYFELGAALGPLTITHEGDNDVYSREFEDGTVVIEFGPAGNTTSVGVSPR